MQQWRANLRLQASQSSSDLLDNSPAPALSSPRRRSVQSLNEEVRTPSSTQCVKRRRGEPRSTWERHRLFSWGSVFDVKSTPRGCRCVLMMFYLIVMWFNMISTCWERCVCMLCHHLLLVLRHSSGYSPITLHVANIEFDFTIKLFTSHTFDVAHDILLVGIAIGTSFGSNKRWLLAFLLQSGISMLGCCCSL